MRYIFLLLLLTLLIFNFDCVTDNEDANSPAPWGKEHLLQGGWWIDSDSDGGYFNGAGGGYDLDIDSFGTKFIVCNDPIKYYYDGTNFMKCEDGRCIVGTLEIIDPSTAKVIINGETKTVEAVSFDGSCE